MPHITIDGVNYHYSAKTPGEGDPRQAVLFIHGAGGSHLRWVHQVAGLGREYLAMAVDLPGHGMSEGVPSDQIARYREFVHSFAERLLEFRFFVAGHSMGGAVALDFALNYPGRLAGLILMGTGCRLRVHPSILEAFKNGNPPQDIPLLMYRPDTPETVLKSAGEEVKGVDPAVYYSDFTACDRFNACDRLGEINIPTLVLTGDKDAMTPVKYGKFLADNIKNAQFEIIEDAGHMVMMEQPGAVNSAVKKFIEKHC